MRMINFFWGVIFIVLGCLFFLSNYGWITVDWSIILSLWPLLIILLGIYFLPGKIQVMSTLALTLIVAGVMVYAVEWGRILNQVNLEAPADKQSLAEPQSDFDYENFTANLTTNFEREFNNARLKLHTKGGAYRLQPIDQNLFQIKSGKNAYQSFNLQQSNNGDTGIVALTLSGITGMRSVEQPMVLGFHQQPVWDLNFDLDSTQSNFNLEPFKLKELNIEAMDAKLRLKLGQRYPQQTIRIDGSRRHVRLQLPNGAGAKLMIRDALPEAVKLKGFRKSGPSTYETNNYPMADNQIRIKLKSRPKELVIHRH